MDGAVFLRTFQYRHIDCAFQGNPPVNSAQSAAAVLAIIANRGRTAEDTVVHKTFAAELGQLVDGLADGPDPTDSATLARLAEQMAKSFGVKPDEVAILTLAHGGKILKFLIPEKLQAVGTIPLNSTASLAARTARENRRSSSITSPSRGTPAYLKECRWAGPRAN